MSAFDRIDFNGPGGPQVRAMLEMRLQELCRKLEDSQMSERDTQALRGGIHEIRRLLAPGPPRIAIPSYNDPAQKGLRSHPEVA